MLAAPGHPPAALPTNHPDGNWGAMDGDARGHAGRAPCPGQQRGRSRLCPPRTLPRPPLSLGGWRGERQLRIGTTLRHICNELGREPAALAWPCVQPIFGDCQLLPGFHSGCSPARAQLGSGKTRGSTGGGGHGWGPPCLAGMSRCCWAGGVHRMGGTAAGGTAPC